MPPRDAVGIGRLIRCAAHVLKSMHGASGSLLCAEEDGTNWIVKFAQNRQHKRVAITEYLVSYVARSLGLTVPESGIIAIPRHLLENHFSTIALPTSQRANYEAGLHYGSRYVGKGLMPGLVLETLPPRLNSIASVINRREAVGMLVVDTWLDNQDLRQVLFTPLGRSSQLRAFWIDHGCCLGFGDWHFGLPTFGSVLHTEFYRDLRSWSDLEPWLALVRSFPLESLWDIFHETPATWRDDDDEEFGFLLTQLDQRRRNIVPLISDVLQKRREVIPNFLGEL